MSEQKSNYWYTPTTLGQGKQFFGIVPIQFFLDPEVKHSRTLQSVFVALCQYANAVTGLVGEYDYQTKTYHCPTIKTIAAIAGLSYYNASRCIAPLQKLGWIRVKHRMNKAPIIHLCMPERLQLLGDDGRFAFLPAVMTEDEYAEYREYLDSKALNSETEQVAREFGLTADEYQHELEIRAAASSDGTVDLPELWSDLEAAKPAKASKKPAKAVSVPSRAVEETSVMPQVQELADDPEYYSDEVSAEGITLDDALLDYVRNYDDGGGNIYLNSQIQHFGFTHFTPFSQVYAKHKEKVDAIRAAEAG